MYAILENAQLGLPWRWPSLVDSLPACSHRWAAPIFWWFVYETMAVYPFHWWYCGRSCGELEMPSVCTACQLPGCLPFCQSLIPNLYLRLSSLCGMSARQPLIIYARQPAFWFVHLSALVCPSVLPCLCLWVYRPVNDQNAYTLVYL